VTKRATGVAKVAPGSDPGQHLPALARALADKVRPSKTPLTRSEALAACPWDASMPAAWERETRAAYADRLEERGLALPAKAAGRSGSSGKNQLERRTFRQTPAEFASQDARAAAAGLSWSTWARRKLAT
jgi:hypothetical protein